MRLSPALAWLAAVAPTSAWLSNAQAEPVDQVTVIGERDSPTAPGIEAARAQLARVPGGANVVAREEYADGRASNLLDVLALTPGVYIQPRFGAEEARLSIRGSGLQRTFHLRGIYLLQDGVPITLADGGGDFQAIEPMALTHTEVLRGANALQYGSIALGGSINFVSPSGYDGSGWHPRLESGSFGYRRGFLSYGDVLSRGQTQDKAGATDYFVSASTYQLDGYRHWSAQQNSRVFGNLGVRWREHLQSRFYLAAVHSDSQLPGALTLGQLRADATRANAGNLAGRHKRDFELYRLASRTVLELGADSIEAVAGYSYKDLSHPIFQLLQQRSHDYLLGVRYSLQHQFAGHDNRLVLGANAAWNTLLEHRFINAAGRAGPRTGEGQQSSRNWTGYLENQLRLQDAWTLVTGAQWTQARRRLVDRFLSNGDQSLDAQYTHVSPKLGFLWQPGETWTVFGNVSDSFEPPSFGELFGGPGVSSLTAQRARTVELGARGSAERWMWDLAIYSAQVRDELLSLNTPFGQPLGTVNAPRTVHQGVEGAASIQLAPSLAGRVAWLLNDFKFRNHASYGNNRLPGIAQQLYRAELAWTFHPSLTLTFTGELSPRRYPVDMANSLLADSYALCGVKLARRAERGISWFIEGRNLADRRYAATTGVIADAGGRDLAQFYPGDGRAIYAGLEMQL